MKIWAVSEDMADCCDHKFFATEELANNYIKSLKQGQDNIFEDADGGWWFEPVLEEFVVDSGNS